MAYKDIYGITRIRSKEESYQDVLSISIDEGWFGDDIIPVLLYIPDYEEEDHSHIELNKEQAIKLRDWLNKYLEDPDPTKKLKEDKIRLKEDVSKRKNK